MKRLEQRILQELRGSAKSYWHLLRESEADGPSFTRALGGLLGREWIEARGEFLYLTEKGREASISFRGIEDVTCSHCRGRTVSPNGQFEDLLERFNKISQGRPEAISDYDQGCILPEDTIARVLYLYRRGDLEGSEILFLGDDDLTSLACALTGLPRRIQVLEIDSRLNEFLRQRARENRWDNYQVLDYDARAPIPENLEGQFDVFFTDPVETISGITLFLSRCVSGLKGENSAGYFGLTRIECPLFKWQQIQKNLLDMNFVITDIVRNFHEYVLEAKGIEEKGYRIHSNAPFKPGPPDVNFFRSNLVRIEALGLPRASIREKVAWGRDLYYDEEMWVTLP